MRPRALISIHAVMPRTLPDVLATLELLAASDVATASLLVVPGATWAGEALDTLHALDAEGHELVAHGWQYDTRPRRPVHRLHAALVSRGDAEHLSMNRREITRMMCRSQHWFKEHALQVPATYIPPAWALGRLTRADMVALPYSAIETLRGVHVKQADGSYRLVPMPLLGFEAGSALRVRFLADWNRLQLRLSRRSGRLPRIALHPADYRLPLGNQLRATLALGWTSVPYSSLPDGVSGGWREARA